MLSTFSDPCCESSCLGCAKVRYSEALEGIADALILIPKGVGVDKHVKLGPRIISFDRLVRKHIRQDSRNSNLTTNSVCVGADSAGGESRSTRESSRVALLLGR